MKNANYERKAVYPLEAVLPFIATSRDKTAENAERDYDGDMVKMFSQRYHLFSKNCTCVSCGVVGTYFAKERSVDKRGEPTTPRYHFNLYGIDKNGNEVMLTKDHIVPASKGGKDHLSNYQTMCYTCNQLKGNRYA